MQHKIAVLLTCHNRREKTLNCLSSLYNSEIPNAYRLVVYLVDDGSSDGTGESVKHQFPDVNIIPGTGQLFWAGGMRLAWRTALQHGRFNGFLLINDDVVLKSDFFVKLIEAEQYALGRFKKVGIYAGATESATTQKVSYGALRITQNHLLLRTRVLLPQVTPLSCHMTNANILYVHSNVVDQIGVFDEKFTHGMADYDYTFNAYRKGIPLLLAAGVLGYCENDHGVNWKSSKHSLKERLIYLKSPLGLAYHEYLYYIRKNFPLFLPYSFIMLWLKTLLPFLWDRFK